MNGLIGTKEAARRLNISIRRVQALITVGRLPAEKIGNSYAIKESDLSRLNGRKSGRSSAPSKERTQGEWNGILDRVLGSVSLGGDRSTNKKSMKGYGRSDRGRARAFVPIEKDWDSILDTVAGKHDFGPGDLATNKKHLEGFGRD